MTPKTHFVRLSLLLLVLAVFADSAFAAGKVVISQIYGGGGNSGATLKSDFIELYNSGDEAVPLAGWSVQYAATTGSSWQVTPLSGSILPGHYYLIKEANGLGGTVDLTAPDATGGIPMGAAAGKVVLIKTTTQITSGTSNPLVTLPALVVDFVGFGTTTNAFEGAGPTANLSNTTAALRKNNGCQDTDNNSADFSTGSPNPRNSSNSNTCDGDVIPPPTRPIHDIQGPGSQSPFNNTDVQTSGVVTAVKSNGFFLQTKDALVDADPNTSEGIFVFTSSAPPAATVAVGNEVSVVGKIQEFRPSADVNSPPVTELASISSITLVSTGNLLPAAITLTAANTVPGGPIDQLEKYEGMRVHVDSLTVSGPTGGSVDEENATSTSNGIFYGVITGIDRPFREPGIEVPDPLPAGAPATVTRFDANAERLRVDSKGQSGSTILNLSAGAIVTNLTGPLDYAFRTYTILQDPTPAPAVTPGITVVPVPVPSADELTVASFNMERFFDTVNDTNTSDAVLTSTAFDARLNKASLVIRNVMRSPDIIGVEEVENRTTLQAIAAKVNADTIAAGGSDPHYEARLVEGVDIGGIDVGYLVKTSKVTILDVKQEEVGEYTPPGATTPAVLNDRPSLTMHVKVSRPKADDLLLTVIVNHLRSLSDVDSPTDGARVRAKRKAQADFLAALLQQYQEAGEKVISVGDYNAFGFNDGYVDSMGIIQGHPAPATETTLAGDDGVNPDYIDLANLLPAVQRYSFNFDGNAQELDHVLVDADAQPLVTRFAIARVNSDFPEAYRGDGNRPERLSDHDPAVAYFQLPAQDFDPPVLTLPADIITEATGPDGAAVTFAATAIDAATGSASVDCNSSSGLTFPLGTTTIACSATDGHGNTASGTFTITVRDTTAPTIVITSPSGTYTLNQAVTAQFSCSDLVAVASCLGGAVDTSTIGTHTYTVNAMDTSGNTASSSAQYDVAVAVCVLYDQTRANKSGNTVPIKIRLCDGAGNNQSSAATTITAISVTSGNAAYPPQDAGNANAGNLFRFDGDGYIYNLKTVGLAPGAYSLNFQVQGETATHAVQFQVR